MTSEKTVLSVDRDVVIAVNAPAMTDWPVFFTVDEAADLLRTSRKAVYAMMAREQLPGVARLGRRVLIRSADLLDWLGQKSAPSPKE